MPFEVVSWVKSPARLELAGDFILWNYLNQISITFHV